MKSTSRPITVLTRVIRIPLYNNLNTFFFIGMDSRARRFSCPSSGNVVQRKKARVSLNDMSTEFDHRLSTGSLLRRVCLTCHTPLILSARKCKSCKSKLAIIWYRRVDTTGWRNPRKPPIYIPYPRNYAQCKYFLKGKECVNNPCHFAHGKDELEIWELYRSRGNFFQDYTIATNSLVLTHTFSLHESETWW